MMSKNLPQTLPASSPNKRRQFLKKSTGYVGAAALGGLSVKPLLAQDETAPEDPLPKYGIEGFIAPEVTLDYWIDGDGKPTTFSVEGARGKWVFMKFFQNWCPGCHSSGFPTLKAVCDEFYGHEMVEIAGIQTVFEGYSTNTQDKVRELQQRYDIPAVMGHDPGDKEAHIPAVTMINYRTGGTPWLVLVAPDGSVVFNNFHVNRTKLIEYLHEQIG